MSYYPSSVPARLLALATGFLFAGGGMAALVSGQATVAISALSAIIAVVLGIYAVGLAAGEHTEATVYGLVVLPFALFLSQIGIWLAITYASGVGVGLMAFGLLGIAIAAAPGRATDREEHVHAGAHTSAGRA